MELGQKDLEDLKVAIRILGDTKLSLGMDMMCVQRIPNERVSDYIQLKEIDKRMKASDFKIMQAEAVILSILTPPAPNTPEAGGE